MEHKFFQKLRLHLNWSIVLLTVQFLAGNFFTEHNLREMTLTNCYQTLQTVLGLAVITNQTEVVRQLVHYGADVTVTIASHGYKSHEQPLHVAASRGTAWLNTLRHLLKHPKIDINACNSDGQFKFSIIRKLF